ncbi:hypothetical protein T4B_4378 [Trichinella pseudospiralis]|uniref:Uncharacterized protein n=1 Tax=Trichinella pseudospiralis TaxID=6337 RepID=A0A0V1JTY6_TRIPS|nr:hypothetical protein T4A_4200 [Trichinella pseudospiralis]KRZ22573.1 hypothetical protein T4B_4378 [Trichinella pseudospiralis]KRZ38427.1 hypothetical protein T4C_13971 [Trichinella pseudospiralis]
MLNDLLQSCIEIETLSIHSLLIAKKSNHMRMAFNRVFFWQFDNTSGKADIENHCHKIEVCVDGLLKKVL